MKLAFCGDNQFLSRKLKRNEYGHLNPLTNLQQYSSVKFKQELNSIFYPHLIKNWIGSRLR